MTGDLGVRLERALSLQEKQESGARPDAAVLAELHARVRRARLRRSTSYAGVAAAAAGVVAVAGWLGMSQDPPPQPAHTPTPTASTPGPSATPTATPSVAPEPVVVERAGAPLLHELPPGMLESAGTGWVLAQYAPVDQVAHPGRLPGVVALLDPAGVAYLVADLTTPDVSVIDWQPGAPTATVLVPRDDGPHLQRGVLDLRTGAVTPAPAGLGTIGDSDGFVGHRADGAELWWVQAASDVELWSLLDGRAERVGSPVPSGRHRGAVLSPDGAWLAVPTSSDRGDALGGYHGDAAVVVDVRTGTSTEVLLDRSGGECLPMTWTDARTLLASCVEHEAVADQEGEAGDVVRSWYTEATLDGSVTSFDASEPAGYLAATAGGTTSLAAALVDDGEQRPRGATLRVWQPGVGAGPVAASLDVDRVLLGVHSAGRGRLVLRVGTSYEDPGPVELWSLDSGTGQAVHIGPHGEGADALEVVGAVVVP